MSLTLDLTFASATDLAREIRQRHVSPVEVVESLLRRIERLDPALNAFVHLDAERALAAARAAEIEIGAGGYRGPLHGVPVAYKDLFDVQGLPTTAASKVMAGYVAPADSSVAARMRQAGAVCLGKLNTQEFASGGMELFGETRNPWDTSRTSGGSSAGSAAAVAAGLVYLAAGTDTGGSIRIPAGFCGVVGLKPTYGRVSRAGIVPLSWSMDYPGPLARTIGDAAVMLQAIAGADPRDPAAAPVAVPDYPGALRRDLTGVRLGLPRDFFFDNGDPQTIAAIRAAVEVMQHLGATVFEVDLPHAGYGQAAAWAIAYSEALAFHRARLFARASDYGRAIVRKVAIGGFVTAHELVAAHQVRQVLSAEFAAVLQNVDVIVAPNTLFPAHLVGTMFPNAERPLGIPPEGDLSLLTRPVSLTGLPALAVPCGFTAEHLPIGMQLIGRSFEESTLLHVGHAYESATAWSRRRPPVDDPQPVPVPPPPASTAPPLRATPINAIDATWVRETARLSGLTFLDDTDFEPIAASLGPIKALLRQAAETFLAGIEPATRRAV